jgi:superfamily I DNA/RNA helicase
MEKGFTEAMREAIELKSGRLHVAGPPGTGKTRLLVERFAHVVERGADPERVPRGRRASTCSAACVARSPC